ncbi:MAG: hypothetical protein A4E62_00055 [Syntrophorhabdus sp. PtaU1.Bin002]|nr:MAG: hypothetical protein A4E62_00055 [Syntrophorhabdus sp. PtaU1.Bin002]
MRLFVLGKDLSVVPHKDRFFLSKLRQWRQGRDNKIPIVRMLLFEIVFWLHFWIAVVKDIGKTPHDLLDLTLREFRAYPDDEAGYFGHMDLPPLWSRNHIKPCFGRGRQVL